MAVTQDELYATLNLELSWSERDLPERERMQHVHRLHPYHGNNAASALRPDAPVLVVVNDSRDLHREILTRAGLPLESRLRRHVNCRSGRCAGEYFEDVLVARAASSACPRPRVGSPSLRPRLRR